MLIIWVFWFVPVVWTRYPATPPVVDIQDVFRD